MNATLFGVSGIYKGTYGSLAEGRLIIGREAPARLLFSNDITVSRQHAALFFENGIWYLVDLGSTNGTFVDNERIGSSAVRLDSGAVLRFGQQTLRIDFLQVSVPSAAQIELQLEPRPAVAPNVEYKIRDSAITNGSSSQLRGDKPHRVSNAPDRARWFGRGETLVLGRHQIKDPLVYAGKRLRTPSRKNSTVLENGFQLVNPATDEDEEPSLVIPSLVVSGNAAPEQIGYYQSYRWMSPSQRDVYLEWLQGGRRSQVEQGYLMVFLYGIERRLMGAEQQPPDRSEQTQLLEEIELLIENYPTYSSFRRRAIRLIIANWGNAPEFIKSEYLQQLPNVDGLNGEFEWALACMAGADRQFTAREAIAWLKSTRKHIGSGTVVKRCWREIEQLFTSRFIARHDGAVSLEKANHEITYSYMPSNYTIRTELRRGALTTRSASNSNSILAEISELAHDCVLALTEFSRKLGPNPTIGGRIRAQTALPAEIRQAAPVASALSNELRSISNGAISTFALGKLLSLAGFGDLPPSKSVIVDLCSTLNAAGFIMEPDPRFGAITPAPHDLVCVAPVKGSSDPPSLDYLAAVPLATLAASVARSDRRHASEKQSAIVAELTNAFNLSEIERQRLNIYLVWVETAEPRASKSTVDRIAPESREAVADLLVAIAIADGSVVPEEMAELLRIFKMLGLPEARLYSSLHNTQSNGFSPVNPSAAPQPAEARPGNIAPPASFIDMGVVQSKLKSTEHISAILTEIFTDDAADELPVFVATQASASSLGIPLLERLTPGEISAGAFEMMASEAGLLPNAAFEMLNNLAIETCNGLLLDGEDPIYVDGDVLKELQT